MYVNICNVKKHAAWPHTVFLVILLLRTHIQMAILILRRYQTSSEISFILKYAYIKV